MPEFAYFEFVREWPELVVAINQLELRLRRVGRTVAADELLRAFGLLRDELLTLGRQMAVRATELLRQVERDTRVRPDTAGGGGPRLEDALVAEVIPDQRLLPGSIGVANEDILDAQVPWWLTNEIGSTAHIGRHLFGYFYGEDDEAPPDETEFRVHPLFEPGPSPVSGMGIIKNPIPARRFIAKAVPLIDREWQQGFHSAKSKFDVKLAQVLATYR